MGATRYHFDNRCQRCLLYRSSPPPPVRSRRPRWVSPSAPPDASPAAPAAPIRQGRLDRTCRPTPPSAGIRYLKDIWHVRRCRPRPSHIARRRSLEGQGPSKRVHFAADALGLARTQSLRILSAFNETFYQQRRLSTSTFTARHPRAIYHHGYHIHLPPAGVTAHPDLIAAP